MFLSHLQPLSEHEFATERRKGHAKTRSQTSKHDESSIAKPRTTQSRVTKAATKVASRVKKAVLPSKRKKLTSLKQSRGVEQTLTDTRKDQTKKSKAEQNAIPLAPKAKGPRDCTVCGEHRPATAFRIRTPTSKCKHSSSTCRTCVSQWISTQLEKGQHDGISCPECPQILEKSDIMAVGNKASHERYEYLANLDHLSKQKGFVRCLNHNCDSGQIHGYKRGKKLSHQDPKFICRTCRKQYCLDCKTTWHRGKLCIEMFAATPAEKKKQEAESLEMVERTAKKCPNTKCGRPIEKTGGCNHIYCTFCYTTFCWLCLAVYGRWIYNEHGNPIEQPVVHKHGCIYYGTGN